MLSTPPRDNVVALADIIDSPLRTLPRNDQAEQAFLGALLANNKVLGMVADYLRPMHFAEPVHGRIYGTASALITAGHVADAVTLRDRFQNTGVLDPVGGTPYLAQLLSAMVGVINAPSYAHAIVETWRRREIIEIARQLADDAFATDGESRAITEVALDRLDKITSGLGDKSKLITMDDAVQSAVIEASTAARRGRGLGLSTGMAQCDDLLGGLRRKKLTILGGVEGMGKAQPLDVPVLLAAGYFVPMGELRVGDMLASIDGQVSRVMVIHERQVRKVFRVTFSDGRSTRACANHLWSVSSPMWGRTRTIDTRKLMRLLTIPTYVGRLHVEQVSGHFGTPHDFVLDPYELGLCARFTPDCRIPAAYLSATLDDRLALLRGLFDGGCIEQTGGDLVYYAATLHLSEVARDLARSLGCTCRSYAADDRRGYACRIGADAPWALVGRGAASALGLRPASGSSRLSVAEVAPAGECMTQCITVTHPSQLYVTDDYVVTHNSALGWQWAMNVAREMRAEREAKREWGAVVGFSLEMTAEDLAMRALSPLVGMSFKSLTSGKNYHGAAEVERRLANAREDLRGMPLFLTDGSSLSVEMMRLRLRQIKRHCGRIVLVVVDHLHITKDDGSSPSRVAQVEAIALAFKEVGVEFDCAMLVLAQLVKDVQRREDHRPGRADVAYGGATHADNVVLVHREEHYLDRATPIQRKNEPQAAYLARVADWERATREHAGTGDLIFDKVRGGNAGLVKVLFDGPTTSFRERE